MFASPFTVYQGRMLAEGGMGQCAVVPGPGFKVTCHVQVKWP